MTSEAELTAGLANLTLNDFKTQATVNLKVFHYVRGKNSDVGQESLATKAFSSWGDKVPVNPELKRKGRCNREECKVKLIIKKLCYPRSVVSEKWMDW